VKLNSTDYHEVLTKFLIVSFGFFLIFIFPELANAQVLRPESDGGALEGIHNQLADATRVTIVNLNRTDGFVNQLANIIWRFVTFVLFVWIMFQYVWGETTFLGITYFIIFSSFVFLFINANINGVNVYAFITTNYFAGVSGLADELFGLTTSTSLDNYVTFLLVAMANTTIRGVDCGLFCLGDIVAALGGLIITASLGLMIALSYIMRIIIETGLAIILAVGLLTVPLALFQFGQSIFFGWLRAVVSFTFSLWFVYIVLGFVANMLASYLGLTTAQMTPDYWNTATIEWTINSFDDIWAPFFISLIGMISIVSAYSWGQLIGGAAIGGTSGFRSATALKLLAL